MGRAVGTQQASARGHGAHVPPRGRWAALTAPWRGARWEKWSLAASERLCARCLPPPAPRAEDAPSPGRGGCLPEAGLGGPAQAAQVLRVPGRAASVLAPNPSLRQTVRVPRRTAERG